MRIDNSKLRSPALARCIFSTFGYRATLTNKFTYNFREFHELVRAPYAKSGERYTEYKYDFGSFSRAEMACIFSVKRFSWAASNQ
jgi:hypothetical protein